MVQTSRLSAGMKIVQANTPDGGQARADLELIFALDFSHGVASGQANVGFIDKNRAIADGATEDFDLVGVLVDALGQTVNAAEVVGVFIRNTGTTNLTIGGATHEWQGPFAAAGDKLVLRPGEWVALGSNTGWAAGAGASDDILITNAAGAAGAFDIGILGRTS